MANVKICSKTILVIPISTIESLAEVSTNLRHVYRQGLTSRSF